MHPNKPLDQILGGELKRTLASTVKQLLILRMAEIHCSRHVTFGFQFFFPWLKFVVQKMFGLLCLKKAINLTSKPRSRETLYVVRIF